MTKQLTSETIKEVLEQDNLVVLDFWAPWCGPCRILGPTLDSLSEKESNENVTIAKVNVDDYGEIATNYGIRNIPTVLFIKNNEVLDKSIGAAPESKIQEMIDKYND